MLPRSRLNRSCAGRSEPARTTSCGREFVHHDELLNRNRNNNQLGNPVPTGHLLRYGTSLSEAEVPVSEATREAGLGYTAPSNLHHWVGYAAVGYR